MPTRNPSIFLRLPETSITDERLRTMALSDQFYRSLGSVSANLAEGYSRRAGRDRARFYEYALGSAGETRDWYYKYDFHVHIVDLMHSREGSQGGVAFSVALYSLLQEKPVQAGPVILGEMTIQGNILPMRSLVEPLQVIMDNGAKRVLIPVSNRRQFMEVPPDILERVDPIFYSEPLAAALKALGIG